MLTHAPQIRRFLDLWLWKASYPPLLTLDLILPPISYTAEAFTSFQPLPATTCIDPLLYGLQNKAETAEPGWDSLSVYQYTSCSSRHLKFQAPKTSSNLIGCQNTLLPFRYLPSSDSHFLTCPSSPPLKSQLLQGQTHLCKSITRHSEPSPAQKVMLWND